MNGTILTLAALAPLALGSARAQPPRPVGEGSADRKTNIGLGLLLLAGASSSVGFAPPSSSTAATRASNPVVSRPPPSSTTPSSPAVMSR